MPNGYWKPPDMLNLLKIGFFPNFASAVGKLDGLWYSVKNKGEKKGHPETEESGQFFRSTMLDMDSPCGLRGVSGGDG